MYPNNKTINRYVIENTVLSALTDVLLEPRMVDCFLDGYKEQSQEILERLQRSRASKTVKLQDIKKREAAILDAIRPMIDHVVLTPDGDKLRARGEGDITKLSSFEHKDGWHFYALAPNITCLRVRST